MNKPDGKKKQAPVVHAPNYSKRQRTLENKARRMARDAKLKAKKQQATYHAHDQQGNMNMFYLAQRLRAQHIHQQVEKQVKRVEHVKLVKSMYALEARAHVVR